MAGTAEDELPTYEQAVRRMVVLEAENARLKLTVRLLAKELKALAGWAAAINWDRRRNTVEWMRGLWKLVISAQALLGRREVKDAKA